MATYEPKTLNKKCSSSTIVVLFLNKFHNVSLINVNWLFRQLVHEFEPLFPDAESCFDLEKFFVDLMLHPIFHINLHEGYIPSPSLFKAIACLDILTHSQLEIIKLNCKFDRNTTKTWTFYGPYKLGEPEKHVFASIPNKYDHIPYERKFGSNYIFHNGHDYFLYHIMRYIHRNPQWELMLYLDDDTPPSPTVSTED